MAGENAERFRKVAAAFTVRVEAIGGEAWSLPTPCVGWTARDVVRHLIEWVPPFIHDGTEVALVAQQPVDRDPVAAWLELSAQLQSILDAPGLSGSLFDHPYVGRHTLGDAVTLFILPDVLIHTWDLARAIGADEQLDPELAAHVLEALLPMAPVIATVGVFGDGPSGTVGEDAPAHERLLDLSGRRP